MSHDESSTTENGLEAPSFYSNPPARQWRTDPVSSEVLEFHQGLPGYRPSSLIELPSLAAELGVGRVFVKDESSRLGLPAFKIVGASYAVSRTLSARVGSPDRALPLDVLRERLSAVEPVTLVAATDGNHGRAIANMARRLGLPARIFVPAHLTKAAWAAIESEGAEVVGVDAPYDDVVLAARAFVDGEKGRALLVQDTAWSGYTTIPQWIVDGYSTIFAEADDQLRALGVQADLVAVPVGVGSLAEAAVRHFRSLPAGSVPPTILSVEPENAPAVMVSLLADAVVSVPTSFSIMAGLNCGTPSINSWPYLRDGVDAAVTVTEDEARRAVHDLEGLGVDAGPCGAATLAGIRSVVEHGQRERLGLTTEAIVLLISTESRGANPI